MEIPIPQCERKDMLIASQNVSQLWRSCLTFPDSVWQNVRQFLKICRTIFIVKNVVIISQSGISKICLKPWFNINMSSYQYMKSVWKPIAEIKTIETWFPILIKHIYIESGPLKFYSNIPVANELNNFLVIIKHVFLDY